MFVSLTPSPRISGISPSKLEALTFTWSGERFSGYSILKASIPALLHVIQVLSMAFMLGGDRLETRY